MMSATTAPFVSRDSAMKVTAGLIHVTTKQPGRYLDVWVVRPEDAADMNEPRLLQVKLDPAGPFGPYTWDDELGEIAHCITPDGTFVDITLGFPGNGRVNNLAYVTVVE